MNGEEENYMRTPVFKMLLVALVGSAVCAPLTGCTKVPVSTQPSGNQSVADDNSSTTTDKSHESAQSDQASGENGIAKVGDAKVYQTADAISSNSDLIVVAHYSESPEAADGTVEYQLEVDQVLSGDAGQKELTFSQRGKPDNDKYERKLKKDTKYILFLTPDEEDEDTYCALGAEQGILEILNDGKVYPYSGTGITATYVDMNSQEVISAIQSASH